uniref:Uncharacterized protein n=1 Tax=Cajanus cajan TaxID=3821 RepID=A0A151UCN3_CAJCA|nr:hypothetical protein KK1_021272 [Cajanus cajan]
MHQPGIEPGSVPWQGTILPLDHWCLDNISILLFSNYLIDMGFEPNCFMAPNAYFIILI